MANSDKNIKITPNISQTAQPNVVFTGQGAVPITLKVLDDSFGTLSFEGSAGQLFSVNNNLSTGVIFSVNDISGIPQIDVNADGTIRLAPFGTTLNVGGIGGSAFTIQPSTRASTGAGASVTIAAGAGVTTGAGGSVILQPGAQAASGGDGKVFFNRSNGNSNFNISRDADSSITLNMTAVADNHYFRILRTDASRYLDIVPSASGNTQSIQASGNLYFTASSVTLGGGTRIFGGFDNNYAFYISGRHGVTTVISDLSTSTGGSLAFPSNSPSGYAANQDNLVLTGSAFQRLSGTAARDITGVAPPTGGSHVDGRMMRIYNVGSFNLTLKHNSSSSTAANRFFCVQSADVVIATNDFAELIYDSTNNGSGAAGWRVA